VIQKISEKIIASIVKIKDKNIIKAIKFNKKKDFKIKINKITETTSRERGLNKINSHYKSY
jgi:hypothetical protein